jgi:hypothetical protein
MEFTDAGWKLAVAARQGSSKLTLIFAADSAEISARWLNWQPEVLDA